MFILGKQNKMDKFCCICNAPLDQSAEAEICDQCLEEVDYDMFEAAMDDEFENILDPFNHNFNAVPVEDVNLDSNFDADIFTFIEHQVLESLNLRSDNHINLNPSDWPFLHCILALLEGQIYDDIEDESE